VSTHLRIVSCIENFQNIIDGIKRRKNGFKKKQRTQIDRMLYVRPVEGERYYLHVLLNHVRGATSFDDLKTIGTTLNCVHDFFNPVYLHVCGGTSQKLSMLFVWLYLSIYHMFLDSVQYVSLVLSVPLLTSLSMITFSGGRTSATF
jgi:hypothetical protein